MVHQDKEGAVHREDEVALGKKFCAEVRLGGDIHV